MRMSLSLFAVISCVLVGGCTTVTEQDLADLESPNAVVKKEAIERISKEPASPLPFTDGLVSRANEKRAVTTMLELLRSGKESEDTELSILKALGQLGKRTEVPVSPLIEKLKNGTPRIRARAIETLGKTKSEKALAALLKLLKQERDKYPIIWALGEIGDQGAIPTLNRLLGSEDKYLRYNAYRALAKMQTSNQVESNSNTRSLLDIGGMAFKKYQETMMVVFRKIAGFKRTDEKVASSLATRSLC